MSDYTRAEAAAALKISLATLDRWLADRAMPITRRKVGRKVYVSRAQVDKLATGRAARRTATVIDLTNPAA